MWREILQAIPRWVEVGYNYVARLYGAFKNHVVLGPAVPRLLGP